MNRFCLRVCVRVSFFVFGRSYTDLSFTALWKSMAVRQQLVLQMEGAMQAKCKRGSSRAILSVWHHEQGRY